MSPDHYRIIRRSIAFLKSHNEESNLIFEPIIHTCTKANFPKINMEKLRKEEEED